jgi:ribosomal protein S18 acetylase RimI-like enzyme
MGHGAPSIRAARPADAPLLGAAERAIAARPGELASLPEEIDDGALRQRIVDFDGGERGILWHVVRLTIAVHEGHQGQGVGRALMTELLRWARQSPSIDKVELQVRSTNERAIALYRSLGFIEEGRKTKRLKIAPGVYLDDVYMALWVGP